MIEILTPKSREEWLALRKDTIGASEVAAILGVHPYMTPWELYCRKQNHGASQEETKAMRRGRLLEDDCIEILREERPEWLIQHNPMPGGEFYRDRDAGISCTPDAYVNGPQGVGICQIKTVNEHTFREEWHDGIPTHVAIQTIQEAFLTGASWACVAAFVGMDLEPHIMDVELHSAIVIKIRDAVQEFLLRVRTNRPPEPDYARDADIIRARYAEDDGGEVDLSGNERVAYLLDERDECKSHEIDGQIAERERKIIDAELIHLLGNATRGTLGDGRYIEAATVRKKECVHKATTYRTIKIKQRKEK